MKNNTNNNGVSETKSRKPRKSTGRKLPRWKLKKLQNDDPDTSFDEKACELIVECGKDQPKKGKSKKKDKISKRSTRSRKRTKRNNDECSNAPPRKKTKSS